MRLEAKQGYNSDVTTNRLGMTEAEIAVVADVDRMLFNAIRIGMDHVSVERILGPPLFQFGNKWRYRRPHTTMTPQDSVYAMAAITSSIPIPGLLLINNHPTDLSQPITSLVSIRQCRRGKMPVAARTECAPYPAAP